MCSTTKFTVHVYRQHYPLDRGMDRLQVFRWNFSHKETM